MTDRVDKLMQGSEEGYPKKPKKYNGTV